MGSGLSKLGAALIIIFVLLVVALIAQLFYVFWRHRLFRRQTNTVNGRTGDNIGDELSQYSSSDSTFSASKEQLLYFFCVRPDQFRLDGNSTDNTILTNDLNFSQRSPKEVIDIDLLKIQGVFGPPRFLFTLKEEEKGNQESSTDKSLCAASTGKGDNQRIGDGDDNRSSLNYLKERFQAGDESAVVVEIDDGGDFDTTPFSTPCASPVYFTPSASPVHEVVNAGHLKQSCVLEKTAACQKSESSNF